MESYLSPQQLEHLARRISTTDNFADLRSLYLLAQAAADAFQRVVNPPVVGELVRPTEFDLICGGHQIFSSGDCPVAIDDDDLFQEDFLAGCEDLRMVESALGCVHMDISRLDVRMFQIVRDRADHLRHRLERLGGESSVPVLAINGELRPH